MGLQIYSASFNDPNKVNRMMTNLSTPGGRTNKPHEKPNVFKMVLMIKRAMPEINKSLS
ncbi:hypothetical protein SMGES_30940 [Serratia marcescens]|nr:hypothetical protein SMGES_30940 [Serratia marcescens]